MNLENLVGYLAKTEDRFNQMRGVQLELSRQISKSKKQIKNLRGAVLCLSGALLILIMQVAERKRCELYLQSQIDKLSGKTDDADNDTDNGGAVDA